MEEYFRILKKAIKTNKHIPISELTRELAYKAGYKRENYKFIYGSNRIRTLYDGNFDNELSAKWIIHYSGIFRKNLLRHKDLKDDYVDIINDTFFRFMTSLNIEKIVNDTVTNAFFNACLNSSICEHLKKLYQNRNLQDENLFEQNDVEKDFSECEPFETIDETYFDIHKEVNTYIEKKLLFYMLNKNNRVQFNKIDKYLNLDKKDCNQNTKKDIVNAYNNIVDVMATYYPDRKFKHITEQKLKYSFEKGAIA